MKRLLILCLFLTACADKKETLYQGIDPEFQEFVDEFQVDSIQQGKPVTVYIPINFHEMDGFAGKCKNKAEILIDPDDWESRSVHQQKALIYHELGHCVLGRDHYNETVSDGLFGRPVSIMTEHLGLVDFNSSHFDSYIEELFNN